MVGLTSPALMGGGLFMRRIMLLIAAMTLALLMAAGVALAVTKTCQTNCVGTANPDTLDGSKHPNTIKGLGGGDLIHGWRNDDTLRGNGGRDAVYGDSGDDHVYGNLGNDFVEGGFGHDIIKTGDGSDRVAAKDNYIDHIVCGQGIRDVVHRDNFDTTRGCEHRVSQEPSP
jgi:hypothetical protein